jgi:hypothetical protein
MFVHAFSSGYSIPRASITSPTIEGYLDTRSGWRFQRRSALSGRVSTTSVTLTVPHTVGVPRLSGHPSHPCGSGLCNASRGPSSPGPVFDTPIIGMKQLNRVEVLTGCCTASFAHAAAALN